MRTGATRVSTKNGTSSNFTVGSRSLLDEAGNHRFKIGSTNGIFTSFDKATSTAKSLSSMLGGMEVEGTHRPTTGHLSWDIDWIQEEQHGRAAMGRDLIIERWINFITDSAPGAFYVEVCHSGGAVAVKQALMACPEWVKNRIIVLALGPADHISRELCSRVAHYESDTDRIPATSPHRELAVQQGTVFKIPHARGASSVMDHGIDSPTYVKVMRTFFEDLNQEFGLGIWEN